MGTYVHYSLGDDDGVKTAFLADLGVFLAWLDPRIAEYPDEFPAGMREKILDFMRRGNAALLTASREEARLIDLIVDEYYWNFSFDSHRHPAIDITPSMHKWYRYASELSDVLPAASAIACDYYRALFRGCSLVECDGHVYQSQDDVFHLSWLLPAQVVALLAELEPFESELDAMQDDQAGVLWVLVSLQEAKRAGASLIVAIA
ncbi:hypothetical protein [Massilia sp. CCM 8734]|uniref:hypothetical protein n=1 Tax=Massilia sp. CCM 8734 TaxID=2609283 RepID=UPI00141DF7B7|nr:hypothetical protein [Massilia sp. CCM 8734]NHZ98278.1 hypothetical protein [Massilia sp. CCM 8734]